MLEMQDSMIVDFINLEFHDFFMFNEFGDNNQHLFGLGFRGFFSTCCKSTLGFFCEFY